MADLKREKRERKRERESDRRGRGGSSATIGVLNGKMGRSSVGTRHAHDAESEDEKERFSFPPQPECP
jgi:hypothetical protein